MSLSNSQVFSSDTLAAGVETLAAQGVKVESTPDREEMQKELQDSFLGPPNWLMFQSMGLKSKEA